MSYLARSLGGKIGLCSTLGSRAIAEDWRYTISEAEPPLGAETRSQECSLFRLCAGEPIAAVRVQLKSYALVETQDMVLDRVRIIINEMQKRVLSKEDLME